MTCNAQSIDKALVARRFAHARDTYGSEARVQQQVAEKMLRLLTAHACTSAAAPDGNGDRQQPRNAALSFRHIAEFGCGTGCYSRLLLRTLQPETLLLNDLCPEMEECIHDLLTGGGRLPRAPQAGNASGDDADVEFYGAETPSESTKVPSENAKVPSENTKAPLCGSSPATTAVSFLPCDAETLDFPQGTDLITSCSTLQWFADTERFFARCHRFLSDGGILAFSTFGKKNMREIHALTGHGLEYLSLDNLKVLLSPRFEILYAEEEIVSLPFGTPLEVLRHLKQTGVTGTEKRVWTRGRLQSFCDEYIRMCGNDDRSVSLTYHPIYVIARKRER